MKQVIVPHISLNFGLGYKWNHVLDYRKNKEQIKLWWGRVSLGSYCTKNIGGIDEFPRAHLLSIWHSNHSLWASLVAQMVKNTPAMQETRVQSLGWEDPLENDMANHASILAWEIHGQRSLSGYSPGNCKVRHDLATKLPPSPLHRNRKVCLTIEYFIMRLCKVNNYLCVNAFIISLWSWVSSICQIVC